MWGRSTSRVPLRARSGTRAGRVAECRSPFQHSRGCWICQSDSAGITLPGPIRFKAAEALRGTAPSTGRRAPDGPPAPDWMLGSSAIAPFRHQRQTQPPCCGPSESDETWHKAKPLSSGVLGWSSSSNPFSSIIGIETPTTEGTHIASAVSRVGFRANGRLAATASTAPLGCAGGGCADLK